MPTAATAGILNLGALNTRAFPQHALSLGLSPLCMLLPLNSSPAPSPPGLSKFYCIALAALRHPGLLQPGTHQPSMHSHWGQDVSMYRHIDTSNYRNIDVSTHRCIYVMALIYQTSTYRYINLPIF
jgi:hypothetical protein